MSVASLADNVYITVSTPSPTIAGGNPNLPSAIIGTGSWGALSAPIPFGTTATLYDAIGNISALETFDLATYGTLYLQASQAMGKGGNAYVVRVSDGSDVAAQIAVKDGQGTPGTVIIFVAACTGTRGNSGTATLSKSVGWTTNAPIYDLTLTISGAVAEVFRNIIAYQSGTNGYNSSVFTANCLAAVNNGQNLGRGKSKYWVATLPGSPSTYVPVLQTWTVSTNGTDGASPSTSQLIGTDGLTGRTGIYALRSLGVGQLAIAGFTDFTAAGTLAAFAASESTFDVSLSFPQGTSTATALSTKLTNNVSSIYQAITKNWVQWYDTSVQQLRYVAPNTIALGVIGARNPQSSPGNQPAQGLGFIAGTELGQTPVSALEAAELAQAGIMYVGIMPRSSTLIGFCNGQNASGIAGQDGVNYTRLTNYLTTSLKAIAGPYVDRLQGQQANDPLRAEFKKAIDGFLLSLQQSRAIDSFQTICDFTNNTNVTIPAGQLNATVKVVYLATARFININAVVGVGVSISVANNNTGS